ncbi:NXPE family member 1-like isoform X2 [Lithobates pipiens]
MVKRKFALRVLVFSFLLGFLWHWTAIQHSLKVIVGNCLGHTKQDMVPDKEKVLEPPLKASQLQIQIDGVFTKIQSLIPNVTFSYFNKTTSAQNSKVFLSNPRERYCVGEDFVIQVDMYDYLNNRKTYGGDFIRPRLFSLTPRASVSGKVEDFNNGSYHIHFPLYWAGQIKVSILLWHPSEGITALWRSRHSSLGVLGFQGRYVYLGQQAISPCGFQMNSARELCEYKDNLYEEVFYCQKPPNLACDCLRDMRAVNLGASYLKPEEKPMFERPRVGIEIAKNLKPIIVTNCDVVKYFRHHETGWHSWEKTLEAINMEKDIYVSYKRHGFPLESFVFYYFMEDMYTSRQIDRQGGGKDTIFVITMGQHFRQFPLKLFIRRALNIRRAVERLFLRSPETKVIIKTENTRERNAPLERIGDFHGYTQYLVLKEVFQGVNVGFVDAWDMTVASATESVHPPGYTFEGIMSLTFSFACS